MSFTIEGKTYGPNDPVPPKYQYKMPYNRSPVNAGYKLGTPLNSSENNAKNNDGCGLGFFFDGALGKCCELIDRGLEKKPTTYSTTHSTEAPSASARMRAASPQPQSKIKQDGGKKKSRKSRKSRRSMKTRKTRRSRNPTHK